MNFIRFRDAVHTQFIRMAQHELFKVGAGDLYPLYLASFEPGTNEIFRTNTQHDCNCCKRYIRDLGSIVAVIDNELVSIWDITVPDGYQAVANALAAQVKKSHISTAFRTSTKTRVIGVAHNHQLLDGEVLTYDHFYSPVPSKFVSSYPSKDIGKLNSAAAVLARALETISMSAIDTVLDLIQQQSIYRGAEHKTAVVGFRKLLIEYDSLASISHKANFVWHTSSAIGQAKSAIRNSVIGTLLVDISDGVLVDQAVRSFESKVAPANYKRPNALVTTAMIEKAEKRISELGFLESLARRYASVADLTINNVLFADRTAKKVMNVFDELKADVAINPGKFSKVEEVDVDTFITAILPTATSIEIMPENRHATNFVSLIAPKNTSAPSMLKWSNNFSWSYEGELADSNIKERVKAAGGNVTGYLRCSLSWFNRDDLDVHIKEPNGHIYYGSRCSSSSGTLDVDMNAGSNMSNTPVENIIYTDKSRMPEGDYRVYVNQFAQRTTSDGGFEFEIEFDGTIHQFNYPSTLRHRENVEVAVLRYSHATGLKFIRSLESSTTNKEIWNTPTNQFRKVDVVMNSPNHWDDNKKGNKHLFFMLEGCKNNDVTRGFYNEFLSDDLTEERKVFEMLGSKMKVDPSDTQLSGLGFSSTVRNDVLCKVHGNVDRIVKIKF